MTPSCWRVERIVGETDDVNQSWGMIAMAQGDTARAIVNNWLGLVYKFTHLDRKLQFMPGTDPEDPLGIGANGKQDNSTKESQ